MHLLYLIIGKLDFSKKKLHAVPVKHLELNRFTQAVCRAASWPLTPVILFLVTLSDFFIMLIPSDAFLVAALLGNAKKVVLFVSSMVLGRIAAAAGAVLLAQRIPLETLHQFALDYRLSLAWEKSQYFFETFGPLSIGITNLTPLPVLFPTFMSAVSGAPLWQIVLFCLLGAVIRYGILASAVMGGKYLYLKGK